MVSCFTSVHPCGVVRLFSCSAAASLLTLLLEFICWNVLGHLCIWGIAHSGGPRVVFDLGAMDLRGTVSLGMGTRDFEWSVFLESACWGFVCDTACGVRHVRACAPSIVLFDLL